MDHRVERVLRGAGWYPGRVAPTKVQSWIRQLQGDGFPLSQRAAVALAEFGGLAVAQSGPGIEVALGAFAFTPLSALGEAEYLKGYADALRTTLFPIGEAEDGTAFLMMADDGRVVAIHGNGWILGRTLEAALESLVLGLRGEMFCPEA